MLPAVGVGIAAVDEKQRMTAGRCGCGMLVNLEFAGGHGVVLGCGGQTVGGSTDSGMRVTERGFVCKLKHRTKIKPDWMSCTPPAHITGSALLTSPWPIRPTKTPGW